MGSYMTPPDVDLPLDARIADAEIAKRYESIQDSLDLLFGDVDTKRLEDYMQIPLELRIGELKVHSLRPRYIIQQAMSHHVQQLFELQLPENRLSIATLEAAYRRTVDEYVQQPEIAAMPLDEREKEPTYRRLIEIRDMLHQGLGAVPNSRRSGPMYPIQQNKGPGYYA